jgi:hypothetical protein
MMKLLALLLVANASLIANIRVIMSPPAPVMTLHANGVHPHPPTHTLANLS